MIPLPLGDSGPLTLTASSASSACRRTQRVTEPKVASNLFKKSIPIAYLSHFPTLFPPSASYTMTRIISSALRPLRLNSGRALQGATENAHQTVPVGRRTAATYTPRSTTSAPSTTSKPTPSYSAAYKRSATTTSSSSSSSSSAPKPAATPASSPAAAPRPPTSAFAESQTNPVAQSPYAPPPGLGNIPETTQGTNGFANNGIDWSSSFHGLSTTPFSPEVAAVLMKPIPFDDVEIKPDGIIYLPEIKYRRILNQAFGPGGWGMAPRGELMVGERVVTREYALLVHGRYVVPHGPNASPTWNPKQQAC